MIHIQNPVIIVHFGPRATIMTREMQTHFGPAMQPDWYVEDHHDEEEDDE